MEFPNQFIIARASSDFHVIKIKETQKAICLEPAHKHGRQTSAWFPKTIFNPIISEVTNTPYPNWFQISPSFQLTIKHALAIGTSE
jgi:hypothetical protein